jgi:uncharacterized membrane protein YebE (DUF533 family)
MAESAFLQVIRVWAAMAWADGKIADAEGDALRKLIAGAELADDERATANGFLTAKVELDTSALAGLSLDARKGVYRAACRLAAVDRDVAVGERSFLARLAEGLGLDTEAVAEIERSVPGV